MRPMVTFYAGSHDFNPSRLKPRFNPDGEFVDGGTSLEIRPEPDSEQILATRADLESRVENPAMVFEAVPCQSGGIVERDVGHFAQVFDDGTGKQRVFKGWLAIRSRADKPQGPIIP